MNDNLIERAEEMLDDWDASGDNYDHECPSDHDLAKCVRDLLAEVKRLTPRVIETVEKFAKLPDSTLIGWFHPDGELDTTQRVFDGLPGEFDAEGLALCLNNYWTVRVLYAPEGGDL